MPLIIVSGYPCAGKTHRSTQLIHNFEERIASSTDPRTSRLKIHHVNDESLGVSRDVYHTARAEKDARAEEMSAVKRLLGRDSIVVADGLNYIKGFRYQLFCEAKALQTPSCVVHVGTPIETCRSHHAALTSPASSHPSNTPTYSQVDFENLIFRYEEPNGLTRWDSPLFTVPYDDPDPPYDSIWAALVGAPGEAKVVRPNAATVLKPATEADHLYELDRGTNEVVASIMGWQADHAGEEGGSVPVDGVETRLELPPGGTVGIAQLQRMRRGFIALHRQHVLEKGRAKVLFVDYLNDAFGR